MILRIQYYTNCTMRYCNNVAHFNDFIESADSGGTR